MNRPSISLPSSISMTPSQRSLLLCAAVLAVSLLSFYVHLLQQSVERGEQRRVEQRSAAVEQAMKRSMSKDRFADTR